MMRSISALLLLLLLGLGCKSDPSAEAPIDTVLDIRLDRDPARINPMVFPRPTSREVFQNIFKSPIDRDPYTLELIPILVEEIPKKIKNDDGSVSFEMRFRDEAEWPDGSPITGKDYAFTCKAIVHPLVNAPAYRSFVMNITDIKVDEDDSRKVLVTLAEDYLLALETVGMVEIYPQYVYDNLDRLSTYPYAYLLDTKNEEEITADTTLQAFAEDMNGQRFSQEVVVGAGPYELTSYTNDKQVVLSQKQNYWGDAFPNIPQLSSGPDKMIFHIIPDKTSSLSLLKEGQIDLMDDIDGTDFIELQNSEYASERLNFMSPKMPRVYYLMLNTATPQLEDKRVRHALSHVVDIQTMINVFEGGKAVPINSPIHPSASYYNTELPKHQFEIANAVELLEDAGWTEMDDLGIRTKKIGEQTHRLSLKMAASPGKLSSDMAQIIKEDAKKAGIEIDMIEKDSKSFSQEHVKTGDYHISPLVVNQDLSLYDPYQKWHSDNANKGNNYTGFSSAGLDTLIDNIRSNQDLEVLTPLYKQFQEVVYDEMPIIYLYSPEAKIAYSKNWNIKSTVSRPGYFANDAFPKNN